nr:MAG TPA: hypothetical protein [Caudoviricetes sp.]
MSRGNAKKNHKIFIKPLVSHAYQIFQKEINSQIFIQILSKMR